MTQIPSPYLLLADDDPDDQELFSEPFLEENPGAKIVFMNDGQAVVDFLRKHKGNWPCVVMLDYKMPKLNGADVLIAMEKDEHFKDVHKVVWSTSDNPDYVGTCMRHGANRYFKKPNSIDELNSLIRYLTEIYRSVCTS